MELSLKARELSNSLKTDAATVPDSKVAEI